MSQTSSHTLESYMMRCFVQVVVFRVRTKRPKFFFFFKITAFLFLYYSAHKNYNLESRLGPGPGFSKNWMQLLGVHPKNNNLKKTPHSTTFQCMARGLGHFAAHMKDFIKNGSRIKFLKMLIILMKLFKYSILDHIEIVNTRTNHFSLIVWSSKVGMSK